MRPLFFLFYHPRVKLAHWQRAKHPYYAILLPHGVRLLAPLFFNLPPTRLAYTYHRLWWTFYACPLWCYPCVKGLYVDLQALLPAQLQLTKHPYYAVRIRHTLCLFIPLRLDHPPARLASQFFLWDLKVIYHDDLSLLDHPFLRVGRGALVRLWPHVRPQVPHR
jgi:hypothetical protein